MSADQLLVDWNATDAPYPSDQCIHEVFEERVAQSPRAVAVVYEDERLSYERAECARKSASALFA